MSQNTIIRVAMELNTFCILILVTGIIYLNNHFGKVEGKSNVRIFNINLICMENGESNKMTTELNREETIAFVTWCLPLGFLSRNTC